MGFHKKTTTTTSTVYNESEDTTLEGDTSMKRALQIGLNNYKGTSNDLKGCVNDAYKWTDSTEKKTFDEFNMLEDKKATCKNVKKAMKSLAKKSIKGDVVVISYSGHGSKVNDANGDEADGVDETWFLYDGHLVDDEIRKILASFKEGVKVIVISDSCHSGTVTRSLMTTMSSEDYIKPRYMPPEDALECASVGSRESARPLAYPEEGMNHILISGCKSTEYSYDAYFDKPMGAFTYYATKIIDENPDFTYNEFYTELRKHLPSSKYPQTPQLEGSEELKNSKIF